MPTPHLSANANAKANANNLTCATFEQLFAAANCTHGGSDCILRVQVVPTAKFEASGTAKYVALADNLIPLAAPSEFSLPAATVSIVNVSVVAGSGTDTAKITLHCESEGVALYVWLSTLAHGRFSDNGFMMVANTNTGIDVKEVEFVSFAPVLDLDTLKQSLRVEHLGQHLASPY